MHSISLVRQPAEIPPFAPLVERELRTLAHRYRRAGGIGIRLLNVLGTHTEHMMDRLPPAARAGLRDATRLALLAAFDAAQVSRKSIGDMPGWLDRTATTAMGAVAGAGGLTTTLAELPVTTMMLFRAIQGVAASRGFDSQAEDVRTECLAVFLAAGPLDHDDGANTAFLSTRLFLSGRTAHQLIARVTPRLAGVLGQKLAAQSVPILGAAAGAATNFTYTRYYQEMAEVRFGLRQIASRHAIPPDALAQRFRHHLADSERFPDMTVS